MGRRHAAFGPCPQVVVTSSCVLWPCRHVQRSVGRGEGEEKQPIRIQSLCACVQSCSRDRTPTSTSFERVFPLDLLSTFFQVRTHTHTHQSYLETLNRRTCEKFKSLIVHGKTINVGSVNRVIFFLHDETNKEILNSKYVHT